MYVQYVIVWNTCVEICMYVKNRFDYFA